MSVKDTLDKQLFLNNAAKSIHKNGQDREYCLYELARVMDIIDMEVKFTDEKLLRLKQVVWFIEAYHMEV